MSLFQKAVTLGAPGSATEGNVQVKIYNDHYITSHHINIVCSKIIKICSKTKNKSLFEMHNAPQDGRLWQQLLEEGKKGQRHSERFP